MNTNVAAILWISSALLSVPLTAQAPGRGAPPQAGTLPQPPVVIKQPAAITPPPFPPPQPVSAADLPGPMDFNAPLRWHLFPEGLFETAHPYANHASEWKQVYLPAGAAKMRLYAIGTFELESNYDFFEVWNWKNSAWEVAKRYTGTVGPQRSDEFVGRYYWLKLATDVNRTGQGFKVSVEWRN